MENVRIKKYTVLSLTETKLVEETKLTDSVEADISLLSKSKVKELLNWIDTNTEGEALHVISHDKKTIRVYFTDNDDAFLFKLTWG